ncbi:hypothetical protein Anas_02297 [Armadillidium nasatum]|uniref:Uncharacterized protein n=1 Tax=Armadillidium nasatum TaxID=96803 RepID=A0A5N5SHX2_9CRUS|nr:hypothetical protein Anas_02297 [Armadillidium nasatum]
MAPSQMKIGYRILKPNHSITLVLPRNLNITNASAKHLKMTSTEKLLLSSLDGGELEMRVNGLLVEFRKARINVSIRDISEISEMFYLVSINKAFEMCLSDKDDARSFTKYFIC